MGVECWNRTDVAGPQSGETRLFVASVCRSLVFAGDFTAVCNKGQQTSRSRSRGTHQTSAAVGWAECRVREDEE